MIEIKTFSELDKFLVRKNKANFLFKGSSFWKEEMYEAEVEKKQFWKEVTYSYYFFFLDKNNKRLSWAWNWYEKNKENLVSTLKLKMRTTFNFKEKEKSTYLDDLNLSI